MTAGNATALLARFAVAQQCEHWRSRPNNTDSPCPCEAAAARAEYLEECDPVGMG